MPDSLDCAVLRVAGTHQVPHAITALNEPLSSACRTAAPLFSLDACLHSVSGV